MSASRPSMESAPSPEGESEAAAPPEPRGWRAAFHPEILSALGRGYGRDQLARDVMAGLIVGVVALPLAIAFAVASGLSPEKGLVTAVVAGFLISLLGGSRVQIGGPTGAFIVIVVAVVREYGYDGLVLSTMMAGLMLVAFGLLRFGNVIKFIPHPVIVGFTSGIALTILTTQVKDAFGLTVDGSPDGFLDRWAAYGRAAGTANGWAVGLAALTVALVVAGKRFFGKVPGSLVAVVATTALVAAFKLPVDTIGSRFADWPTSFSPAWPSFDAARVVECLKPAFTIALLGAIESLLSAVVADGMIGTRHRSNTELIAQGVANIAAPLFGGMPATGAIARTATNVKSGGRSPVAGIVHALTLLAILLALGPYAKRIPMPCLAGVLAVVAYNMSEWRSFAAILRASRSEAAVLVATFALTVLVDLAVAIEFGMVMAAFLFVQRMANLGAVFNITGDGGAEAERPEDYSGLPAGVDVFEISGPFFFAAARQYQEVLQNIGPGSKVVVIRMRHVPFVDTTGMRNFSDAIRFMRARGRTVVLSGVRPNVLRDLRRHGVAALVGEDRIFPSFDLAIAAIRAWLGETATLAAPAAAPASPSAPSDGADGDAGR